MIKNIQAQYLELIFIDFICLSQINDIKIQITMDINTNRVFSISAIILGLYIIFTYLWGSNITVKEKVSKSKIREDFHVGCYLNDHNLTHSSRLSFRVDEIKSQSFKKLYNSDSSLIPNDYLQKKGIEVAQNFEKFIQSYNVVRARTLSNIELSRALSKAKQQFQNCVQELNGQSSFSERDCTDDWESYKNCEGDLSNLKRDLDVSLNQKDGITQKLKKLLDRGVQPIPVAGPKSDFEKEFKRKYAQLQTKQRNLQGEVRRLSLKITQDQYHLDILENNTYHSIKIYNSCALHRNQYKLCEELGVEVRSLGHGSIQNLESKIKKKQAALLKMNETLKGDPDSHQLKVFVEKSFLEFKKLMKLFVETKAKMIRHCGCSESDQIQLRQEMEKNKKEKQGKQRQIRQNRQIQLEKIGELDRVREQMKKLQDELQIKIHKLSSQNPVINNDAILKLGQLQRQSESNSKVIKELQDKFKILDGKCKQIKSRLTQNVKGVSKINDCLNSFHYYSEIKKKYEKQAPKQIKMDAILKRKLFKSVEQFRV